MRDPLAKTCSDIWKCLWHLSGRVQHCDDQYAFTDDAIDDSVRVLKDLAEARVAVLSHFRAMKGC